MSAKKSRKRIAELEATVTAMRERAKSDAKMIDKLLKEMSTMAQLVAGQPETILAGITPLFLGYQDADPKKKSQVQEIVTAMGSQGLDNAGGEGSRGWFPDIEFDETMEAPQSWPTPHEMNQNGNGYRASDPSVQRADGQPMFRTGETAPPPASAME